MSAPPIRNSLFCVLLMQFKVTLISISGKEARISQIYDIHLGEGLKDVRQSDIFTLYGEDRDKIRHSAIYLAR
ncbi:hypothetical protein F4810DRAFT_659107 [Camillea tinctor]|nr:hypothetical protein F4810DRAFT_659107 [Camillea tinctor]